MSKERHILDAFLPSLHRSAEEIGAAVERLTVYGEALGLTRDAAAEVVTVWMRETTLSVTQDEVLFRAPLRYRALREPWEPDRFVDAEGLARSVAPIVKLLDEQ